MISKRIEFTARLPRRPRADSAIAIRISAGQFDIDERRVNARQYRDVFNKLSRHYSQLQ